MFILGLTGPIASGKSFVESCFEKAGFAVIDTDKVVHEIYASDASVCQELSGSLGVDILSDAGFVCRNKLRAVISEVPGRLKIVESIMHPAVYSAVHNRLQTFAIKGFGVCVLTVPLMHKSNFKTLCHEIATCDCPPSVRRARALERPHVTEKIIDIIMNKQESSESYCQLADVVIDTSTTKEYTESQVASIIKRLFDEGEMR